MTTAVDDGDGTVTHTFTSVVLGKPSDQVAVRCDGKKIEHWNPKTEKWELFDTRDKEIGA